MKTTMLALFLSAFTWTTQAQEQNSVFQGKWNIEAPMAPYGYHEGELNFEQKNGKLTAEVDLPYTDLKINQLTKESFGYSCTENIDGSEVRIEFILTKENGKEQLKAIAKADGQVIDVKLTRK